MSSYAEHFFNEVVKNSESNEWHEAVLEWDIVGWAEDVKSSSSCICGKENIRFLYEIENRLNKKVLHPIGSSCIQKFEREDLNEIMSIKEALFGLLERVRINEFLTLKESGFTRNLLKYFFDNNVFKANQYNGFDPEKDYQFLLDMFNRRKEPSVAQTKKIRGLIFYTIKPFLDEQLKDRTNNS